MELLWLLDRATGLVGYAVLYLAVLTGIFYEAREFGVLHVAARRVHIEVSVLAIIVIAVHALLGAVDTWLVVAGQAPPPAYSTGYLLAGVLVGAGSVLLVVVSVLGFLDARRFERPWTPRIIHAFAYGGFAFATIHAAAIGTDLAGFVRPALVATSTFLAYVLLLRLITRLGVPTLSAERTQ